MVLFQCSTDEQEMQFYYGDSDGEPKLEPGSRIKHFASFDEETNPLDPVRPLHTRHDTTQNANQIRTNQQTDTDTDEPYPTPFTPSCHKHRMAMYLQDLNLYIKESYV